MIGAVYLTPPEVAQRLRIKSQTVRNLIRTGQLAAVDLARKGCVRPRFRISEADLLVFLQTRAVRPPVPRSRRRRRQQGDVIEFF